MAHLDATTELDRAIFEKAIFPAGDPLTSTSRILDPLMSARNTMTLRGSARRFCSCYKISRTIIAILGMTSFHLKTRSSSRVARRMSVTCRRPDVRRRGILRIRLVIRVAARIPCAASKKSSMASARLARAGVSSGRDHRRRARRKLSGWRAEKIARSQFWNGADVPIQAHHSLRRAVRGRGRAGHRPKRNR